MGSSERTTSTIDWGPFSSLSVRIHFREALVGREEMRDEIHSYCCDTPDSLVSMSVQLVGRFAQKYKYCSGVLAAVGLGI